MLPPIPAYNLPIVDKNGCMTPEFQRFLQQLFDALKAAGIT